MYDSKISQDWFSYMQSFKRGKITSYSRIHMQSGLSHYGRILLVRIRYLIFLMHISIELDFSQEFHSRRCFFCVFIETDFYSFLSSPCASSEFSIVQNYCKHTKHLNREKQSSLLFSSC